MDISDYKHKYGEPQTLEEILNYCAFLLNQSGLEHRTLHYFNWFVSSIIFGKTEYERSKTITAHRYKTKAANVGKHLIARSSVKALDIYNKYNGIYSNCKEHPLLDYAKAFMEYCETEYSDDNHEY